MTCNGWNSFKVLGWPPSAILSGSLKGKRNASPDHSSALWGSMKEARCRQLRNLPLLAPYILPPPLSPCSTSQEFLSFDLLPSSSSTSSSSPSSSPSSSSSSPVVPFLFVLGFFPPLPLPIPIPFHPSSRRPVLALFPRFLPVGHRGVSTLLSVLSPRHPQRASAGQPSLFANVSEPSLIKPCPPPPDSFIPPPRVDPSRRWKPIHRSSLAPRNPRREPADRRQETIVVLPRRSYSDRFAREGRGGTAPAIEGLFT